MGQSSISSKYISPTQVITDWLKGHGFKDTDNFYIKYAYIRKEYVDYFYAVWYPARKLVRKPYLLIASNVSRPRELKYPLMFIVPYSYIVERKSDYFRCDFSWRRPYISGELVQFQIVVPGLTIPLTAEEYDESDDVVMKALNTTKATKYGKFK